MDLVSPASLHFSQGLGREGGEQLWNDRAKINAEKHDAIYIIHQRLISIDYQEEKGKYLDTNYCLLLRKTLEDISHGKRGRDACLTAPYSPPSFLSEEHFSNGFLPQPQHHNPWIHELLSLMVHGPFSQVEEMKEVPPLPWLLPWFSLPGLTSHVWQRSTGQNISFPFSIFWK